MIKGSRVLLIFSPLIFTSQVSLFTELYSDEEKNIAPHVITFSSDLPAGGNREVFKFFSTAFRFNLPLSHSLSLSLYLVTSNRKVLAIDLGAGVQIVNHFDLFVFFSYCRQLLSPSFFVVVFFFNRFQRQFSVCADCSRPFCSCSYLSLSSLVEVLHGRLFSFNFFCPATQWTFVCCFLS